MTRFCGGAIFCLDPASLGCRMTEVMGVTGGSKWGRI